MENNYNILEINIVMDAPHKLNQWWRNIHREHGVEIRTHLGALAAMMNILADKVLKRLLIGFWDPDKVFSSSSIVNCHYMLL